MYKAILFHPEGDFVIDFRDKKTKEDVWDAIADMGSKWIFYPIPFVATDRTIVDTPEGLEFLINHKIKTVQKYFEEYWKEDADYICNSLNKGVPLQFIYHRQ